MPPDKPDNNNNLLVRNWAHILKDQKQVFRLLYAIWPKSKDLYPTYLKATQPPSILGKHQVTIKLARLVTRKSRLAFMIS